MTQPMPFGKDAAIPGKGEELTTQTRDGKTIRVLRNEVEGTWILAVSDPRENLDESALQNRREQFLRMTHDSFFGNAIIASLDPEGHLTLSILDTSPPDDSLETELRCETLTQLLDQHNNASRPDPQIEPALQQGVIKV